MRKKHVSETVASKAVWLCDESHSHSGDESITRIPKEKWIENPLSVHLADDTLKQATREREREKISGERRRRRQEVRAKRARGSVSHDLLLLRSWVFTRWWCV